MFRCLPCRRRVARRGVALWALLLCACQVTTPIQPQATSTVAAPSIRSTAAPPIAPTIAPTITLEATAAVYLPRIENGAFTPTPLPTNTPAPTSTPAPTDTPTPTPVPTNTPLPAPTIQISRPLANEFVPTTITVVGSVLAQSGGSVTLSLRTEDGQPVGPAPVPATTAVVNGDLTFRGEITLELPPTPRAVVVIVQYAPGEGQPVIGEAGQPISLLGRYARVNGLIVETPRPQQRPSGDQMAVAGVAPGPRAKILARLLGPDDAVLESREARLDWIEQGFPYSFSANLPNNPAATQLQVIALGPGDAVISAVRVPLGPPVP